MYMTRNFTRIYDRVNTFSGDKILWKTVENVKGQLPQ